MKRGSFCKLGLAASLILLPFTNGCMRAASAPPGGTPPVAVATDTTAPAVVPTLAPNTPSAPSPAPAPAPVATNNPAETLAAEIDDTAGDGISRAAVKPLTTEIMPPANLNLSDPLKEILKLVNAGVEEAVMLAFVTNSTSLFDLGADQIIYLNDIGVPASVVTAMIQHDQARQGPVTGLAGTAPAAGATNLIAPLGSAATTSNPAPAPDQVAPQPAPTASSFPADPAPPPTQPTEVVTETVFYDGLAPYGTWVEVNGYGRVWRPSVVVVNPYWQPYSDCGRWVYSDCGWYWMSDYSWGWAPFHYGRWFRHHHLGWCWTPGYVWGPSWVSWRYTDTHCGWAPLPPAAHFSFGIGITFGGHPVHHYDDCGLRPHHYSFVAWNNFHGRDLHRHRLAPRHAEDVYRRSTVATRISGDRRTVSNTGLPASRVEAVTRTPVRPVAIREVTTGTPRPGRAEQLNPTRRTLEVYRPRSIEALAPQDGAPVNAGPRGTRPSTSPSTVADVPVRPRSAPGRETAPGIVSNPEKPAPTAGNPRPVSTVTTIPSRPSGSPTATPTTRPDRTAPPRVTTAPTTPVTATPANPLPGTTQPRSTIGRDPTPWSTRAPTPASTAPVTPRAVPQQPAPAPTFTDRRPTTSGPANPTSPSAVPTRPAPQSPGNGNFSRPAISPAPAIPRASTPSAVPPSVSVPRSAPSQVPQMAPSRPAPAPAQSVQRSAPAPTQPVQRSAPAPSFTPAPRPSAPAPAPAQRESRPVPSSSGSRPTTDRQQR
jgi:hypothetical protein